MGKGHNPYGQLAGVADPSVPGWQERVIAMVRESTEARGGTAPTRLAFRASARHALLIARAARSREMPVTHYMRRAVAAMVAHDLGMDVADVVREDGAVISVAEHHPRPKGWRIGRDDGTGYGPWTIEGLR